MTDQSEQDAVDTIVGQWGVERPEMDVSALQVFGRLHRAYLLYQSSLASLFAEFDLNMASFDVLAALRRNGPPYRMTSGELAKTMLVTTGGVTLRVDRLDKAGLVERKRDPDDRRIVYVCLTTTGLRVIDQAASAHFANELQLLQGLDDADLTALSALLKKLESSIIGAADDQNNEAHSA